MCSSSMLPNTIEKGDASNFCWIQLFPTFWLLGCHQEEVALQVDIGPPWLI
jgi:hypothetical protein